MDEVYCPTAARNEVLILLSWLTVVLVLFSRRVNANPVKEEILVELARKRIERRKEREAWL